MVYKKSVSATLHLKMQIFIRIMIFLCELLCVLFWNGVFVSNILTTTWPDGEEDEYSGIDMDFRQKKEWYLREQSYGFFFAISSCS